MVTRSVSFGPSAGAADTESTIGVAYTFAGNGRIKKIRIAYQNAVVAKAYAALLYLYFKKLTGPFEFATGGVGGLTAAGTVYGWTTEEVDVDIPYDNGEVVTVKLKASETVAEVTISLLCVE